MRIPGARVVSTVVATDAAAAARPMTSRPWAARNRSTMSALPPPGPPLLASATITRTRPLSQAQKPAAARRGKASERAPTCSGTTATARPSSSGTSTPKTRPTRKATNSCGSAPASKSGVVAVDALGAEEHAEDGGAGEGEERAPMKLRPMTLESLDVTHEASDASALPVTSSAADPVGTSATVSGAMSVVLIGVGGTLLGHRRSAGRAGHYRSLARWRSITRSTRRGPALRPARRRSARRTAP